MNQTSRIGIVGILKLDGVYDAWNEVLELWEGLCESWVKMYKTDSLWIASFYGHTQLLHKMKECDPINLRKNLNQGNVEYFGRTPLIVAVERDHWETAKFLIETGADEDIPDFTLNRPIHLVKSGRMAEILQYNDKLNSSGLSALEIALEALSTDTLKIFIKNEIKVPLEKLLEAAVKAKSDQSIHFLARHYVIKSFSGDLLIKAVENGSYEVFKYLIANNCPIPDDCLQVARSVGNVGILRYLEKQHKNNETEK